MYLLSLSRSGMANLRTKVPDLRGLDSSGAGQESPLLSCRGKSSAHCAYGREIILVGISLRPISLLTLWIPGGFTQA